MTAIETAATAAETPQPTTPTPRLAAVAFWIGVASLLALPIAPLSILLGLAGIVLGLVALRRRDGRRSSIIGTTLSGLGLLAGVAMLFISVIAAPILLSSVDHRLQHPQAASADAERQPEGREKTEVETIESPCYHYDVPAEQIDVATTFSREQCETSLVIAAAGTTRPGGDPEAASSRVSILAAPMTSDALDSWGNGHGLDAAVRGFDINVFPRQGTVEQLREEISLDGQAANLTRFEDRDDGVESYAVLAITPEPYWSVAGAIEVMLVLITAPSGQGMATVDTVVDGWRWV